ncbi:putative IclR family transcriptional regulator [Streptomyces sp. NBRC 110611]|uniref:IclR family transcriptional regulator n=1 Tax=Streptomyces sp. NBRC 110611 TaxID=1621259 RepID=UPI00082D6179|nr:helix-turn-helix domain-containing protein [Streptomyces sp. NBRC 110611]GAU65720.1 putative IclR family transcriptional regulator [Streptomyces sp. NBRC 110611]
MKVLDRAVAVLTAVAEGERDVSGIAAATGVPRSTAHRLLRSLREHRLVDEDEESGLVVGSWVHELGAVANSGALARVAPDVVELLCAHTRLSVQLYQRRSDRVECLVAASPVSGLRDVVETGTVIPLGGDAASQVLTAWDDRPAVAGGPGEALRRVRSRGWALTEEADSHIVLSVPVRAASRRVVAALSLSGPPRLRKDAARLRGQLRKAAEALENELRGAWPE